MSKIPYREDKSISQNIARIREHTGKSNQDLGKQIGVDGAVFGTYASRGFKTTAGNETPVTKKVRDHVASFFANGIPTVSLKQNKVDLFKIMNCASCEFRSRSHQGCVKFSISREEINNGFFITMLDGAGFSLSEKSPCHYARVTP